MKEKLKNFIWNDLPLRLSTHIIIFAGLVPIVLLILILCYFVEYKTTDSVTPLGYMLYLCDVIPIVTVIAVLLFIIENARKNFRLKFKFFQSKILKILILSFYALSVICTYIIPSVIILLFSI